MSVSIARSLRLLSLVAAVPLLSLAGCGPDKGRGGVEPSPAPRSKDATDFFRDQLQKKRTTPAPAPPPK
jgi:hypothetical protein